MHLAGGRTQYRPRPVRGTGLRSRGRAAPLSMFHSSHESCVEQLIEFWTDNFVFKVRPDPRVVSAVVTTARNRSFFVNRAAAVLAIEMAAIAVRAAGNEIGMSEVP